MKVRVKQAHKTPEDGRWIDHPLGQELEIDQKKFANNLHDPVKAEPDKKGKDK